MDPYFSPDRWEGRIGATNDERTAGLGDAAVVIVALTHAQLNSWWVAIGIGFVVVLFLALLLYLLTRFLAHVDQTVTHVSDATKGLGRDIPVSLSDQASESGTTGPRRPRSQ